jgi:hypothetical protein
MLSFCHLMLYHLQLPLLPLQVKQRENKLFVDFLPVDSINNLLSTFFHRRSEEVGLHAPQLKVGSPVHAVQPFRKVLMSSLEQFWRKVKGSSSMSSQNLYHSECHLSCCRSEGTVSLLQPDFESPDIVPCRNCMKFLGDWSWSATFGTDGSVLPSAAASVSHTSPSWRYTCG